MEENKTTVLQQSTDIKTEEQEIDLIELAGKIFKSWKLIVKVCGFAIVFGLVVGFSFPKEYTTEIQLAPEFKDASVNNNLGGLAAIAGINLGSSTSGDAFSPELYPDIVKSTPFLLEFFSIQVSDINNNINCSLYEYLGEYQKGVWWGPIIGAPFNLLNWLRGLFSKKELAEEVVHQGTVYWLSDEDEKILRILQERIRVEVDKKTYVISITVQMQDPLISAEVNQFVLEKLQEYVILYRTKKANLDKEFTEKVYEEAKERYFEVQREYAGFQDSNRHINSEVYRTGLEKRRNEVNLAFSVYNSLAQKLEQDRLRVQEQTPVFAVLEPAKVPLRPSSPRKLLILLGFTFLGGVLSIAYILFKDFFKSIYSEIKNS